MDTVTPSKVLEVEVDLKDGASGIDIAKGTFALDYTTEYDYAVATSKRVEGKHSYATVHYTTFRFAITATVNVLYTAQHDGMVLLQMFMENLWLIVAWDILTMMMLNKNVIFRELFSRSNEMSLRV